MKYKDIYIFIFMDTIDCLEEFDFWKELNKDERIEEKHCLISKEPLTIHALTLPCGHTFNYAPLCREIVKLKYPTSTFKSPLCLKRNQIRCPYCRTIINQLLPRLPMYDLNLPKNICSNTNCIPMKPCEYVFKRGKRCGETCNQPSGFISEQGITCLQHYTKKMKKE
uniref:RING-type domain-containing protein n=1 Tax=viral metagenome TaxID=1070528 RepID=A0A6C0JXB2_9ZZZZ